MLSKIFISEIDINKIKKGQEVNVTVDAFPSKFFRGYITYVANIGEKLPNTNDKVFEVQIRLEETDPSLRPSMTTGNKVNIRKLGDVIFVPMECVQAGDRQYPIRIQEKWHQADSAYGRCQRQEHDN